MRVLSLFSGGGLGDYGLTLAGMEIVGQVEIDDYCQKILSLRWPEVPKWRDIRDVKGSEVLEKCGSVDLVSGGFPCQPFSVAGGREGSEDERFLWGEMHRVICEVKPRWVLAENVTGLLSIDAGRTFGRVLRDLAESGYRIWWDCIPANALGAPHRRDRVWIVAHAISERCDERTNKSRKKRKAIGGGISSVCSKVVADSNGIGLEKCGNEGSGEEVYSLWTSNQDWNACSSRTWWKSEPNVGRVAHGTPKRMDRLKLLGNGQVVQVVEWIGKRIMEFDRQH